MKQHFTLTFALIAFISPASNASTPPLNLDVTRDVPAATPSPLGQGTTISAQGHTINCDSRSFFLDGQPWIPLVGEFHFSRYPSAEWRDELLKMKAGGLNTVSTYVFWIHHEEEQGKFDWNGQRSLRDFLKLCRELGLKVLVRMGPWDHGEVRNGGFPDWLLKSGCRLRSTDPAFMKHAGRLFREEAGQMAGLLWKDAQGRRLWRCSFAGRDRLILSDATVLGDGADLRLQVDKAEALEMSMFPPVPFVTIGEKKLKGSANGIFARFTPDCLSPTPPINVTVTQDRGSSPNLPKFQGTNDEVWNDASVYTLNLPAISANRHILLDLHYTGDAARIYIGGKLFNDHFYNGDPISVGLWRIPSEQWSKVRLKVLPYIDALRNILPEEAQRRVDQAKAETSLNLVTVSVKEEIEMRGKP